MKQKFKCWVSEYGDEEFADEVEDFNSQYAAETYCERHHDGCAEYPADAVIFVKDEAGKIEKFNVTWEAVRNYHAELKP